MDGKVARGDIRKLQRLSIICIVWFLFSTLILRSLIKNHFLVMASIYHLFLKIAQFSDKIFKLLKKKMFNWIIPKTLEIAKSTFFGNLTYMAAPPCDFSTLCSTIPKVMQSKSRCIFKQFLNYVGARIYQGIRMIKRSEMRPHGGATFWDNHPPAVTKILTPILICLKPKILPIRWCHFL